MRCDVTIGAGNVKHPSATFIVQAPTVDKFEVKRALGADGDINTVEVQDVINAGRYWRLALGKATENTGILFTGSVSVPEGYPLCGWHFSQVFRKTQRSRTDWNGHTQMRADPGHVILDIYYPVAPLPSYPMENYPGEWPTLTLNGDESTSDSPSDPLDAENYESVTCDEEWSTYIMFKPAGANSVFVPLKVCQWRWEATAFGYIDDNNEEWWFVASDAEIEILVPEDTDEYPVWNGNFQDLMYVNVP